MLDAVTVAKDAAPGILTLGIVSTLDSTLASLVDMGVCTWASTEQGLISTKGFHGQITAFAILALAIGQAGGGLSKEEIASLVLALQAIPAALQSFMDKQLQSIRVIAR